MGIERTCAGGYGEHWWRRVRRGAMGLALLMPATGPAMAASADQTAHFVLKPNARETDQVIVHQRRPAPSREFDAAPFALLAAGRIRLNRLLAIRPDLRFIVNRRIAEAPRERIALGLHFARHF